jgi:signal transduction histidine kinase/CheY-like chemotaxis protein
MRVKFITYICLLLCFCCAATNVLAQLKQVPVAQGGVIDLRKQTFDNEIPLNGSWEFYWQQFINPKDSLKHTNRTVNFPFKWSGAIWDGKKLPAFGYASYKLTILLPKTNQRLRISVPDMYCAYRLFLNGDEVASNGTISTSPKGFVPQWMASGTNIRRGVDTVRLVLQVANFVHSKGGISKPMFIAKRDVIELNRRRAEGIDLLLTGCLVMGGFFFLGLYLLGNKDKAILLFSLYSIVYSYRILGTDNYVLHSLLPNISWYVTVRLEYFSLFLGIGLFGLYTRYIYPLDANKLTVYLINFFCFVFAMASLILSPTFFTQLINPFLVVMVFCLVYIPFVYTRAWRNKRPGAIYALMSAVALMFVFGISLFHYWALIPPLQLLSFIGYIAFFFLQSLVLSHRVSFELKKARKDAELGLIAKSEFLSTMSHEIRTPLNSVIGMSHLMLENNPRQDQVEQLEVMLFSANNLLSIVNDVLDYNKIEAGKVSFEHIEMDVQSIARNIVNGLKGLAQDKGINLLLNVDTALQDNVIGDPTRLTQVMTNLVHNAIKFTPKGYVQVNIEVQGQSEISVTLCIQVADTGIGIAKEKQQLIFERFTQADSSTSRGFGGTGLGLAITKRILELQGSGLQLKSEEGNGSTFYFIQTFEKSTNKPQIKDVTASAELAPKPLTGIAILLVEDNPMNVLVAKTYLKRWGAIIDVAENGLEALEKLDVNKHRLVLMDLHMPVMDGYEATQKMRAKGVTIPIVALTANLPKEVEEQAKQVGIDDVVVKPFLPDELYRKVLHYVGGKT